MRVGRWSPDRFPETRLLFFGLTLKFALVNEGKSNRKLANIFAGKNLPMTQKSADLI